MTQVLLTEAHDASAYDSPFQKDPAGGVPALKALFPIVDHEYHLFRKRLKHQLPLAPQVRTVLSMLIVDTHLDLSDMALEGRDLTRPALQQPPLKHGPNVVGFSDLRTGGIGLICGTLFTGPGTYRRNGVDDPASAHQHAAKQIRWYNQQEQAGRLHLVRRRGDLPTVSDPGHCLHTIVLMENADPIQRPSDAGWWFAQGVRIVGMAWRRTRYAGGTGAPGGLTAAGRELACELDKVGMIHDISHLADASFWDLLELSDGPIMASHSNCRALINTDRQISDAMIRAIAARDGVIGINFFDRFLIPASERQRRRATLADVMTHVRHICTVLGDADHVGLGTDFDGGLGRNDVPQEITTAADLPRIADAAARAGFGDVDIRKFLHGNWLRFFQRALPVL